MKKLPGFVLVLAVLLFGAQASGAEFQTYFNGRFDYRVDIPSLFDSAEESDNGDGMTFGSESGMYSLWVWGAHNIFEDDGDSVLEGLAGSVKMVRGTANSGAGFYTAEFYDEDDSNFICHEYGLVTPDTIIAYRLRFPKEERGIMGGITSRMDKSLGPRGGDNPSPDEGFGVQDGRVFRNGTLLEDAQFNPVSSALVSGWAELTPSVSDLIDEDEMGVFFFGPEGNLWGMLPIEGEYGIREVAFCPDDGERFIFEDGSGSRADVFLKVYNVSTMEKMAEFSGIRGSWVWIDPYRCVFTRIDGTRDKGFGYGFGYGLRLSVVMYDTVMKEEFVLKKAADTASYFFEFLDGDELVVTEERVKKAADWDDESKRHEKEIRVEIPAAG